MKTIILKKLQPQSYGRWQANKESHSEGHWQEIRGQFRTAYVVTHVLTTAIVLGHYFQAFFIPEDIPSENGFLQT